MLQRSDGCVDERLSLIQTTKQLATASRITMDWPRQYRCRLSGWPIRRRQSSENRTVVIFKN